MRFVTLPLALLAGLVVAAPAFPADDEKLPESIASSCPDRTLGPVIAPAPDRSTFPVTVMARELDASETEQGEARGDVELIRGDQHLDTSRLLFHPVEQSITLPEPLDYRDQQVWIKAREGSYDFDDENGRFTDLTYGLTGSSANGRAESIELTNGSHSMLREMNYTTCPEEQPDWGIYARELEFRHEEGVGYARGAKLRFKNVPILWAPWFTFPLDDRRKTGFLYPSLGQNSDTGFEIGVALVLEHRAEPGPVTGTALFHPQGVHAER